MCVCVYHPSTASTESDQIRSYEASAGHPLHLFNTTDSDIP